MGAYLSPSIQIAPLTFNQVACMVGIMEIDPLLMVGIWDRKGCGVAQAYLLPRDVDVRISQNNNPTFDIQIKDDDGALIDVDDITALEWRIAPSRFAAATLSKSLADFTTVNVNTFRIQLTPTETNGLLGVRYHEVTATDTDSRVRTVIAGRFNVINRIAGD